MPDGGRIIRAYRNRRVIQRRQKIGPYVVDLRCCLPEAVDHIADMLPVKLPVSLFDCFDWEGLTTDADRGRRAAQNVHQQLHHTLHVVVGVILPEKIIVYLAFHFFSCLASINLHLCRAGGWGIDGWISMARISLIYIIITWVGFLDLCTSEIATS